MILQETCDIASLRTELTDEELAAIQKLHPTPISREQVFAFPAKIIDSQPTKQKRVWTEAYLKQNASKFVGTPLAIDHDADSALMGYGECYHSEFRDNAIHGKFFIPLVNDTNKTLAETIQAEWAKGNKYPVSLRAIARNVEHKDGLLYINPSDDDRILEISLVSASHTPGCQTCTLGEAEPTDIITKQMQEFAEAQLKELQGEYCRLSAFALGTSINRKTYQEIADSVSPLTLKEMVGDLKKLLAEKRKTEQPMENSDRSPVGTEDMTIDRIKQKLQSIRQIKGA